MALGQLAESWVGNFDRSPVDGGVPSEERFRVCHALCLAQCFRKPPSSNRKATLLMGAPGSGKSTATADDGTSVVVNPDAFKAQLPEYDDGKGAAVVHEESSWLAAQARAIAIGRLCNLVNDAVGSNRGKYADLIRQLSQRKWSGTRTLGFPGFSPPCRAS